MGIDKEAVMKAIFFDIDGTLITHENHQMPQSTLLALESLKARGIKVFVATGRAYSAAVFMEKYFNFDGYVCNNGTNGIFQGRQILDIQIPNESLIMMIEYVKQIRLKVSIATDKEVYYGGYQGISYDGPYPVKPIETCLEDRVYQVNFYEGPHLDKDFLAHMPKSKSVRWNDKFADVISIKGGKEVGIRKVLDILNISEEHIAVFGDGENDLSMLKAFKYSFAMGNANEVVKQTASYVTDTIWDDGIYNALKKLNVI